MQSALFGDLPYHSAYILHPANPQFDNKPGLSTFQISFFVCFFSCSNFDRPSLPFRRDRCSIASQAKNDVFFHTFFLENFPVPLRQKKARVVT